MRKPAKGVRGMADLVFKGVVRRKAQLALGIEVKYPAFVWALQTGRRVLLIAWPGGERLKS